MTDTYILLEGNAFSKQTSTKYTNLTDLEARIKLLLSQLPARQLAEANKALSDGVVSVDGVSAISRVIKGDFAFLKALSKAYLQELTLFVSAPQPKEED
jgi:hypothetical protein